jgi:hypothetical protein
MDRPSLRRLIWRLQRDNGKVCKRLTAQGISPLFSRWSAEYAGQYCRLRLFFGARVSGNPHAACNANFAAHMRMQPFFGMTLSRRLF